MRSLRLILNEIERTNRRHALLERGDSVLVGLSGGPDSVALLYVLTMLRRKLGLKLSAAHLDHGLSAEGRDRAEFCGKLCARWDVPLAVERADVRSLAARSRRSLEDTGRRERYAFFERAAAKCRARKIATAHTLDDQAETVLHRLLRGTGIKGLAGIPPVRAAGKTRIIRPLLRCRKSVLVALLREEKVPYRRDPANADPAFTRNRLRRRLLPLLEREFNPRTQEALAELADVCRDAQDSLERLAEAALRRARSGSPGGGAPVKLRIAPLARLPRAVLAETLGRAYELCASTAYRPTFAQTEALIALAGKDGAGAVSLPGGIIAFRAKKDTLELRRR